MKMVPSIAEFLNFEKSKGKCGMGNVIYPYEYETTLELKIEDIKLLSMGRYIDPSLYLEFQLSLFDCAEAV